jgi:hypothetical protein
MVRGNWIILFVSPQHVYLLIWLSYHHVGGVCERGTDEEIVFTRRVDVFSHRRRHPQPRKQNQTYLEKK